MLAYPRSLLPRVLPRAPGEARSPVFLPVFWGLMVADPFLAGLPRVTSEHLWGCCWRTTWSSYNAKASLFPFCLSFPSRPMLPVGQRTGDMNLGQRSYGPSVGLGRPLSPLRPSFKPMRVPRGGIVLIYKYI